MNTKERNYGIDLLRLVLMYMVCMLHTLGQGGVLSVCSFGHMNYNVFWLMEIMAYCAVDGFALLSGYTSSEKPRKYEKLVEMWFQAFFYSFVLTIIFLILGMGNSLNKIDIIKSAFPITFNSFWYFTAFFALFFAIPILNKFIYSIDLNTSKKLFLILFILFSVVSVINDPFQLGGGYSAIWLMILYCIGALSKRIKLFENQSTVFLCFVFLICVLITWVAKVFLNVERWVSYTSPTILLCGMILVIIFSRLKLKGTIISKVSPLAFGIYLFQLNQVVWNTIIKGSFAFVVSKPLAVGILYAFGFAFAIFISGLIVEFIRSKLASILRIPLLSKAIVKWFNFALGKSVALLK